MYKKILSFVLAMAMVFALCPVSIPAQATGEPVYAEQSREVALGPGENVIWVFTPDADDTYCLWVDGPCFEIHVYDPDGNEVTWGSSWCAQDLASGVTYSVVVSNAHDQETQGTFWLMAAAEMTGAHMSEESMTRYAGQVIGLNLISEPTNTVDMGNTQWTVSDESLAEILDCAADFCQLKLLQPGQVTVYAYNDKVDQTYICEVTIESIPTYLPEEPIDFTLNPGEIYRCAFTVPETAEYILWDEHGNWQYLEVFDSEGNHLVGNDNYVQMEFWAEEPHFVTFYNNHHEPLEFRYWLDPIQPVESISLNQTHYDLFEGQKAWVNVNYHPGSAGRQDIQWVSSDDSVVQVTDPSPVNCGFLAVGAGEATITGTLGDLTVSLSVSVGSTERITPDADTCITIEGHSAAAFRFTAPEDGWYTIWDQNLWFHGIDVCNEYGDPFSWGNPNTFEVQEGMTYTIICYNDHHEPMEYNYRLTRTQDPEGIHTEWSEYDLYPGQSAYVRLFWDPHNSFQTHVTWSSINSDVVSIMDDNHENGAWIRAEGSGTAIITAVTDTGMAASCIVRVNDTDLTLTEGNSVQFTLEPGQEISCSVPIAEDGLYVIYDENNNWEQITMFHPDGHHMGDINLWFQFEAAAGECYFATFRNNSGETREFSYRLDFATDEVQELVLHEHELTVYVGQKIWLPVDLIPGNTVRGRLEWTTSDDSVVHITEGNPECCAFIGQSEGTATVTVSMNGVEDSCQVTVRGLAPDILPDDDNIVTIPGHDFTAFRFIAPEDGWYTVWDQNYSYHGIDVQHMGGDTFSWGDPNTFEAEAGFQYLILCYNDWNEEQEYNYRISKTVSPDSISMSEEQLYGCVGEDRHVNLVWNPGNSFSEDVNWTVDDESVVILENSHPHGTDIRLVGPGTATITAVTESGMEASCTIEVSVREQLYLGYGLDVEYQPGNEFNYTFTAPDDGEYVVWTNMESWTWIDVRNWEGNHLNGSVVRNQFTAVKGETYQIWMNCSGEGGICTVTVDKAVPATALFTEWPNDVLNITAPTSCMTVVYAEPANADLRNVTMELIPHTEDFGELVEFDGRNLRFLVEVYQPGEADLVIRDEATGAEVTVKMVANEVHELALDETFEAELTRPEDWFYANFTPEESGFYQVVIDCENFLDLYVFDTVSHTHYNDVYSTGYDTMLVWMDAGTLYNISADLIPGDFGKPETGTFSITVRRAAVPTDLRIVTAPDRTDYVEGFVEDYLVLSGLVLQYIINGEERQWFYDDYQALEGVLEGFDVHCHVDGETVTLECAGETVGFPIRIRENTVTGIEINDYGAPPLIEGAGCVHYYDNPPCYYSIAPVVRKLTVTIHYSNGTAKTIACTGTLDGYGIENSSFDSQAAQNWTPGGENLVTFSYLGATADYRVEMIESNVTGITIDTAPSHVYTLDDGEYVSDSPTMGLRFQPTNLEGLVFTVHYTDGSSEQFSYSNLKDASDVMMNTWFAGDYPLTVTFDEEAGYTPIWIYDGYPLQICYAEPGEYRMRLSYKGAEADYTVRLAGGNEVKRGWSESTVWVLTTDGTLTFSGTGAMKNYGSKTEMPWYSYLGQITRVVIREGVTSIGNNAFYGMPNLTEIEIAQSVTSIGDYAFKGCEQLNGVVLPQGLSNLGESAFYGCTALTSIEIPAALWTIHPYTFKNCSALTDVIFNEGNLMKISDGAFYGTALTELVLPDCLNTLDVYAFKNCTQLTSITLGSGLTELREACFYGTAISEITIPEGIQKIRGYVFKNCLKLTEVDLPESLTSIGEAAFYASGLTRIVMPDNVTTLGSYAFKNCTGLKSLLLSENLTSISEGCFYGCTSLKKLILPDSVTAVEGYAFRNCTAMTALLLSDNLESIGDGAFHTCSQLQYLYLPETLSSIGGYSFSGCSAMKTLTFQGNAPTIGGGAFSKVTATAYYPDGNATWTSAVMQNYGGKITWKSN